MLDKFARIKHDLDTQLNAEAYQQANTLLEGYLQYRNHIGIIKNQYIDQASVTGPDMQLVREIKQAIRDSRTEFLPEDAITSFYAKEDDYDDYMISKVQILSNHSLSAEEKRIELEILDQNTPAELLQSQKQSNQL